MIIHMTHPARVFTPDNLMEVRHEVVVDDADISNLPSSELLSYFPKLRPGWRQHEIICSHDITGAQHHYTIVFREISPLDLGDQTNGSCHTPTRS